MDKHLLASGLNYFDRLRHKARKIDSGVEKLSVIWETPRLLMGGYVERNNDLDINLKEIKNYISTIKDKELKSEMQTMLEETSQQYAEFLTQYESLKKESDSINTVLAEYGYKYEEEFANQNNESNSSVDMCAIESGIDTTILNEPCDIEVEFTPNLTWKSKAKLKKLEETAASNEQSIKGIPTPVISRITSAI